MRTHLDYDAVIALKLCFAMTPRPSQAVRQQLAVSIGVPEKTVTVWFQNRRQRSKARAGISEDRGCPEACKLLFQDEGETTPWWDSGLISALTAPNSPTSVTHPLSFAERWEGEAQCDKYSSEGCMDSYELLESVTAPRASAQPSDSSRGFGVDKRSGSPREAERPIIQILYGGGAYDEKFLLPPTVDSSFSDGGSLVGDLKSDFAACA